MLRYGEAVDMPLERLLEIGQADLAQNKRAFVETAARIDPDKSPSEVMKRITREHPTVETLVQETQDMLEELRQWLLIYDQMGTEEQNRVWVELADRQLDVLKRQRDDLDVTIADLRALRDQVADSLKR